jgi:surfeit locus 1 family protein
LSLTPRQQFWVVTLAALMTIALTARLGFWQLDRAAQKNALQRSIDERGRQPPLAASQLARNADEAAAQHHRRVRVQGRWRAEHTVYLENRQMNGRPGFYVVTPLSLPDGRAIVVQRGWIARHPADRARLPAVPTPAGPVEVEGRIAPPPSRLYEFEGASLGAIRQNLALEAYARETRLTLAPVSLLQEGGPSDGLLREWPRPTLNVRTNYGYAFQWFAFSALITALYVWFQLIAPRRRR